MKPPVPVRACQPRWGALLTLLVVAVGSSAAGCAATAGTAVPATWDSSASFRVLRSVPSTPDSRYSISLVDAASLNRIDTAAERPLSTTSEAWSDRPPSESAWARYALSSASCTRVVESALFSSTVTVRTGPIAETVNVGYGNFDTPSLLSVCQGPINPAVLPDVLQDGSTPSSVAGVDGLQTEQFWVGYQPSGPSTSVIGTEVPDADAETVLGGTPVANSLAVDPGVVAVLKAAPRAATIEMGTFLIGLGSVATADTEVLNAVHAAQTATGHLVLDPVFAGFGWTPGAGLAGTATFVTMYSTDADAADVAAVLNDTWPRLEASTPGSLADATTTSSGSVVVTVIPKVPPDRYDLRTLSLADYPGWGEG